VADDNPIETVFGEPTNPTLTQRATNWYTSRTWWDWLCWVPKTQAVKHVEEFEKGMSVPALLSPKQYGPMRRGVGIAGRALTGLAAWTALCVGYMVASENAPQTTHTLTDWASPIIPYVQTWGNTVLRLDEVLDADHLTFKTPPLRSSSHPHLDHAHHLPSTPHAYVRAVQQIFEDYDTRKLKASPLLQQIPKFNKPRLLFNEITIQTLYEQYTPDDIEHVLNETNHDMWDLTAFAQNKTPIDLVCNPQLLGFDPSHKEFSHFMYCTGLCRGHNPNTIRALNEEYDSQKVVLFVLDAFNPSDLATLRENTVDLNFAFDYSMRQPRRPSALTVVSAWQEQYGK